MLETYFSDKLNEFHGKLEDEGEVSNPHQIALPRMQHRALRGELYCLAEPLCSPTAT